MTPVSTASPATSPDALVSGLGQAAQPQRAVQEPLDAILLFDSRGKWERITRPLHERLWQVLVLGDYTLNRLQGPAQ